MSVFLQRQTVRRRRRWGFKLRQVERVLLSVLIVIVGVFALYGLYRMIFLGGTFQVKNIVVEGRFANLSAEGVEQIAGVHRGDNLFWLSVSQVHERLMQAPWVKDAVVRRRLPDTLWVYVEEHDPAAIVAAGELYYVDAQGTLIKRVEAGESTDYILLTGLGLDEQGHLSGEDVARVREMLAVADRFKVGSFGTKHEVAEVHYDTVRGYSLITRREPMQILIGLSELPQRIDQIDTLSRAIVSKGDRIQYMLANENGRIVVRYRQS